MACSRRSGFSVSCRGHMLEKIGLTVFATSDSEAGVRLMDFHSRQMCGTLASCCKQRRENVLYCRRFR